MHGNAQIEGLQAAPTRVAPGQGLLQVLQQLEVVAHGLADEQRLAVLQRLAYAFAARHLAHTGVARAVVDEHDVAREVGRMRAAEVHEHAVAAGKNRSEEHTSELQSQSNLVCRLLLEKKKKNTEQHISTHVC